MSLLTLATLLYGVQLLHSYEELKMGFHKKWYLFAMPFWVFLTFEIVFNIFWALAIFGSFVQFKQNLLFTFVVLMFLNGIQHIIWACITKRYVPGLYTAPFHVILILIFLSRLL